MSGKGLFLTKINKNKYKILYEVTKNKGIYS